MALHKISIVTINYNDCEGLQKTLQSVFRQSFKNYEYVVVDGGSSDGSRNLIEQYNDRIHWWVSERDRGIYNAINKGLKHVTGDYVLILNAGDTFHSDRTLEEVAPHLESGEDLIYGDSFDVNLPDGQKDFSQTYPDRLSFQLFSVGALRHQATFIRNSAYQKIGFYDESFRIVSDWKWMLMAVAKYGATYKHINVTVCNYDRTGISSTNFSLNEKERSVVLQSEFGFYLNHISEAVPSSPLLKQRVKSVIKAFVPYGLILLWRRFRRR